MKTFTTLTTSKTTRSKSLFKLLREGDEAVKNLLKYPSRETATAYISNLNELNELTRKKIIYFKRSQPNN
jgi:hypothetical protein